MTVSRNVEAGVADSLQNQFADAAGFCGRVSPDDGQRSGCPEAVAIGVR